jgi:hypothetical protein
MTRQQATDTAISLSRATGECYLAIERTDHPHIHGPYFYAIAAADKHAWTPGERVITLAPGPVPLHG